MPKKDGFKNRQVGWRVSWSDSTAVRHSPSQNHFKMEKISTSRKFRRILLPKTIARLRGPCGLTVLYVIGDITWFSIHPPPIRGKIVFTPPRNIAMLFFFLHNFDWLKICLLLFLLALSGLIRNVSPLVRKIKCEIFKKALVLCNKAYILVLCSCSFYDEKKWK